jgi:hypothetical protein
MPRRAVLPAMNVPIVIPPLSEIEQCRMEIILTEEKPALVGARAGFGEKEGEWRII